MRTYQFVGADDSNGIAFFDGENKGSIPKDGEGWAEYEAHKLSGGAINPDPGWNLERIREESLSEIKLSGSRLLEEAGYLPWKQLQMTIFVLGEVIKTLKDTITKSGLTIDTANIDATLAAIPYLTDLTFPPVVGMAAEIGKIRGAVNLLEAEVSAAGSIEDVQLAVGKGIPKPKSRRDVEAGI